MAPQDANSLAQIRALIEKYRDLPFDFADASVAVLVSESATTQVLTLDRDFDIYRDARGRRLKNPLAPTLARSR
jgi:hypothetical protein